ncbi:MFS general substrate transporter [Trametopsis cervina]|nr:MFS general substrate transporter [Trametopsis cervina]
MPPGPEQQQTVEKESIASSISRAIPGQDVSGHPPESYEVTLGPDEDPKLLPLWRRWAAGFIVIGGAICVTGASAMASTVEVDVASEFGVSMEVATLSVTIFVLGLGMGPMLVGPLAAILGQRIIYITSFSLLFAFTFPVAFSHSLAVHLVFRFLGGCCGSAFLSIGGATISDLFSDEEVGTPMAAYTIGTFVGPVTTPIWSGFVYQRAGWRWVYRVLIMWVFVQTILLYVGVPETNLAVILRRKAEKLRATTGDERYFAPVEKEERVSLSKKIGGLCLRIFELIIHDRMALLLDIWLSLILGILYLVFQVFPIIFGGIHHFTPEQVGLTFLGVVVGLAIAMSSQFIWNGTSRRRARKFGSNPPPEVWLEMGKVGGVLIPISLYCLAFTTYANVHWIAPIISSIPFGVGICYVYTSVFTYLVTAFRPMAAEALTGNAIMRTTFAAAFPLFSNQMYNRLGTVGATALLAGLMTIMAPLPFIFGSIGERMRNRSPFAFKSSPKDH